MSKQPANFPESVPAILLMDMGLRAAAIEDLEAELDSAEVYVNNSCRHCCTVW